MQIQPLPLSLSKRPHIVFRQMELTQATVFNQYCHFSGFEWVLLGFTPLNGIPFGAERWNVNGKSNHVQSFAYRDFFRRVLLWSDKKISRADPRSHGKIGKNRRRVFLFAAYRLRGGGDRIKKRFNVFKTRSAIENKNSVTGTPAKQGGQGGWNAMY